MQDDRTMQLRTHNSRIPAYRAIFGCRSLGSYPCLVEVRATITITFTRGSSREHCNLHASGLRYQRLYSGWLPRTGPARELSYDQVPPDTMPPCHLPNSAAAARNAGCACKIPVYLRMPPLLRRPAESLWRAPPYQWPTKKEAPGRKKELDVVTNFKAGWSIKTKPNIYERNERSQRVWLLRQSLSP